MAKGREPLRLDVRKTYALYVNGDSANVARAAREKVLGALGTPTTLAAWSRLAALARTGALLSRR